MILCNLETEKVALMSPKSPCLSSSVGNTIQRQKRRIPNSDNNKTLSSSLEQSRDQYSRSKFSSTQRYHTKIDNDSYFSTSHITSSRTPVDFRKKIHDIYVLPVSPTLSSSSSTTTNTDEIRKPNSNTMPIRSRRHLLSSINTHNDLTYHGIKNDSFADSPLPKNRTLPRSHAGTLRRIQPPSQPPPLPPTHFNDKNKHHFDRDTITYIIEENQIKKTLPPPVPCRSQKPSVLSIGFEEITKQVDKIGIQIMTESSPQNDYSEHTWPNPPDSLSTSQISGPLSIPYDHLIPTIIMHQNSTPNFFHQYRSDEHSMLTESET
jgi:hypothetical protein